MVLMRRALQRTFHWFSTSLHCYSWGSWVRQLFTMLSVKSVLVARLMAVSLSLGLAFLSQVLGVTLRCQLAVPTRYQRKIFLKASSLLSICRLRPCLHHRLIFLISFHSESDFSFQQPEVVLRAQPEDPRDPTGYLNDINNGTILLNFVHFSPPPQFSFHLLIVQAENEARVSPRNLVARVSLQLGIYSCGNCPFRECVHIKLVKLVIVPFPPHRPSSLLCPPS